jgi:hypothetical protein
VSADQPSFTVLFDGDVTIAWDEDAAVHVKCVDAHGDPVEFNADELRTLIGALKIALTQLES